MDYEYYIADSFITDTYPIKDDDLKLGFKAGLVADAFVSFASPAFWVERQKINWFIFSPNAFFEASVTGQFAIKLLHWQFIFKLHLVGFKWTPFELTWAWDLDNKSRRCSSTGGYQEVFDFSLEYEQYVNECYLGAGGYAAN